jgi:chromosome partitioning protein
MIYTIVSDTDTVRNAVLAANLAASLAKEGRKVLLIEANLHMHLLLWTLRRYRREARLNFPVLPLIDGGLYQALQEHGSSYLDIVINVGATNSSTLRTALIAAKVLIVPIERRHMQLKNQDALKKIADAAKLFNPLVQTHLLATGNSAAMSVQDYAAAMALAEQYPGCALLTQQLACNAEALQAFQRGLSVFEDGRVDEAVTRDMTRLCRQLCGGATVKALARQVQ